MLLAVGVGQSTVNLIGNSSGGAIAAALVPIIINRCPHLPEIRLFRFGSPRVGNNEFQRYLSSIVEDNNIVTRGDIVPLLPLFFSSSEVQEIGRPRLPIKAHRLLTYLQAIKAKQAFNGQKEGHY